MRGDFPLDRAAAPRWLTVPMSKLYAWSATRYHNSWDRREPFHASVPVICVGNLAVGGTGKSPTVIALTRLLWDRHPGLREENAIAILSRGYGRQARGIVTVQADTDWRESGDEPLMLKRALPQAAVVVEEDRPQGARHAVERLGAKLILLDDGFQHRPLYRDADLVMIDGEHPLGNGRLLPAGPLREKPAALKRARALISIGQSFQAAALLAKEFDKPLITAHSRTVLPPEIEDTTVQRPLLVTGIARPGRLHKMLEDKNIALAGKLAFADHQPFGPDERLAIFKTATQVGADAILTTAKDRARMDRWEHELPLLTVGLEVEFDDPDPLLALLQPVLAKV